jgi:hypothetical protein
MTDAWTGRKYRGKYTGATYEVLSEPFDWDGNQYVSYVVIGESSGRPTGHEFPMNFEKDDNYARIIEPKFAVGESAKDSFGDSLTIEAVTSKPDRNGKFVYLVREANDTVYALSENYLTKVSE